MDSLIDPDFSWTDFEFRYNDINLVKESFKKIFNSGYFKFIYII